MLLSVGNSWTRVTQGTPEETGWLWEYLAFTDKAREAAARHGGAQVDPVVHLYQRGRGLFPTGLLHQVRTGAAQRGYRLDLVDTRGPMPTPDLSALEAPPLGLRDYQAAAVRAVWQPPQGDPGRGILWVPTGGGKGRIAVALAHTCPGHWVFLVHRSHLAADIAGRWEEITGEPAGWIGEGGWRPDPAERFTVATVQTLHAARGSARFKQLAAGVIGLIGDEIHTGAARTHYGVIQGFGAARVRVGLSATPLARGDGRALVTVAGLGPVLYRIRPEELFSRGVLARPTVRLVPVEQRHTGGTWAAAYKALVVESDARNAAVLECTRRAEKPAMVFVQHVAHGRSLAKQLRARGLQAEFVSGAAGLHQRQRAVADLGSGRLDVVVATTVFTEGVDLPSLRAVIVASGGKSPIATIQRAGRALRVEQGKTTAEIWDIGDKGCHWLAEHTQERIRAYQREGYPLVVDRTVCP